MRSDFGVKIFHIWSLVTVSCYKENWSLYMKISVSTSDKEKVNMPDLTLQIRFSLTH